MISVYKGAKTRVMVESELSVEPEVKFGMDQGSVQSPFLFAIVADVVSVLAIKGVQC